MEQLSYERIHELTDHQFIQRLRSPTSLTLTQLQCFGTQWLLTVQGHKRALRCLPGLDLDEDTVAEVLINLNEEFGGGDPTKSHTRLLHTFLAEVGVAPITVKKDVACSGVTAFTRSTLTHWSGDADPVVAIGFHSALEHAAGIVHGAAAKAVRLADVSRDGREYFELHSIVEQGHAIEADKSVKRVLARDPNSIAGLQQGINAAADAVTELLDGLHNEVFTKTAA